MPTLALHKPYGVLSRFTPDGSAHRPLSALGLPKDVYPVGRLDADSEGLLVLTSDKDLVDAILNPKRAHTKTYLVQVDRVPTADALSTLERGVRIDGDMTRPARARSIEDPALPPRDPPIRFRKSIPTSWIELILTEGRNRQVRRMTAAIGHPTLRLFRAAIGTYTLPPIAPGTWQTLDADDIEALLRPANSMTIAR